VTSFSLLAPDVALLSAQGNTGLAGHRQPSPERASVQMLVAVKSGGVWRFRAFQNTRRRPIGTPGGFFAWRLADLAWKLLGK